MVTTSVSPSPSPAPRPGGMSLPRHVLRLLLMGLALALALVDLGGAARADPARPLWQWPLGAPHTVVRGFDVSHGPYGAGHRGIDIRGAGGTVTAVADGTVHFVGTIAGRGVVSILHADGLLSTYEPVAASVAAGQAVTAGAPIGQLEAGVQHCADTPCLHLGARRGQTYQDPLLLLGGAGPSVLLPLGSGAASARGPADAAVPSRGVVRMRHGVAAISPAEAVRSGAARAATIAVAAARGGPSARGVDEAQARGWAWSTAARNRAEETWV